MLTGVRLIVALCLAEVTVMAGFGTFPALLPTFFAEWNLSNTAAGWINGVYFGAYMVSVPLLVSLTDRIDPRWVYLVSAAVTVLSSLGFAFVADGFWSASLYRALAGVGLAGTYMPGLKALTDHLSPHGPSGLQSRAVAFYTSTFSIGAASSFFLAGEIAAALDWRWAFGLAALGPLVAMLIVAVLVPRSQGHHLIRSETALLDFRPVTRNRSAFAYVLAYSAHNWELFALRSWLVAFLVYAQGLQPDGALGSGWSATTIASLVIVIALPSSVLGNEASERFGRRRVVIGVMGASALTACLLGLLAPLPFALLVGCCLLYGVTVTADSASITSGAVAAARPGQRGATMAVHSFIGFAGAFAGPLAFGVVLDLAGGAGQALAWWLAFASSGLAVAMGPLVLWLMTRNGQTVASTS
jgi:MFS family permease